MARKSHDDALGVIGAETIIGAGVTVHGNLSGSSDIVIDGTLEGSVTTSGDVTIGMNAQIKASVTAMNVTIAGTLIGDVKASGQASIRETGNVTGDVRSAGLAISTGGIFVGRSIMDPPTDRIANNPLIGQESDTNDESIDGLKSGSNKRQHHREP